MKNILTPLSLVLLGFAARPACADELAMPNPILTPGAIDPAASVASVCNRSTKERRLVMASMKAAVLAAYNVPKAESSHYEIDHLVPLAIGGSNALANLWPQPWVVADEMDALEVELQREVCQGLSPKRRCSAISRRTGRHSFSVARDRTVRSMLIKSK